MNCVMIDARREMQQANQREGKRRIAISKSDFPNTFSPPAPEKKKTLPKPKGTLKGNKEMEKNRR